MNHIESRNRNRRQLERAHRAGEAGRFDKSERLYREYAKKYPHDPQVLFNLGVLVQRRADNAAEREEAGRFYQRVWECSDCEPGIKANAMNNLGLIMGKINEIEKATICFHLALQINPELNAARINFGDMLRHNGDYEAADKQFAEVLRLDPNSGAARFSAGMIALMLGDYKRGWKLYEDRFNTESFPTKAFQSVKPKWVGEDLNGKTILITNEQGFGDCFHFWRYCRELKKRWPGCTVWFFGSEQTSNIAKGVDGLDHFISQFDKREQPWDYHVPLMSLPYRLGTTLETIPNEAPWISPVDGWKPYALSDHIPISSPDENKRIGLVWAGSPRHGKDSFRSIAPESFQQLIYDHPQHQFHSLQCGPKADECARLRGVVDLAPTITDWADTAQALMQFDLLISVDTGVVHLAGAVDTPCFCLIPHSPDFRWMLTREDSPWYRKLRLFRQDKPGDWQPALDRINKAL